MSKRAGGWAVVSAAALALAGCASRGGPARVEFQMGERASIGPLTYNVVETAWRSQLGTEFKPRMPQDRFFLVNVTVTNGAGKEVSVPLFSLEDQNGKSYQELDNGESVQNWFGLLREIAPAQTQQGELLFDVPLGSYKLRVTDGGEPGMEKFAWIDLPLRMDTDSGVDTPVPGQMPSPKQ